MSVDTAALPLLSPAPARQLGRLSQADLPSDGIAVPPVKTSRWGGPRPGFGGPQPGSGRPRKPKPVALAPTYSPDSLRWAVLVFWGHAEISGARELTRQGYDTYLP